jgi:adenylate cyclase
VDYIAKVEPIDIGDRRWLVAVVAAEDEFLVEAKRANVRNAFTAGLLTLIAVAVGGVVATLVVRSLGLLVRETSRLERLEFVDDGAMTSRFLEVHQTLEAFKRMKTGLRAFGKYVPMTLVRQLVERGVEPKPGATTKELTLFFSDIRNFTPQSERMTPMELAEWLSRYLSTVTECVHSHSGTVDKYLGDGVVAFWGAPADVPDHAAEACMAALDCAPRVVELGRSAPGDIDFYTRVGIHTATVAVGNFGSADRLNYTAIGDGVNLASRLEGANKVFGTQILISGDTHSRVAGRFETRKIGLVAVKGRGGACVVYELMGEKGCVAEDRVARARRYERALELYFLRKWDEAAAALAQLLEEDRDDKSYAFLAEACRACAESPTPPDTDGAFRMATK